MNRQDDSSSTDGRTFTFEDPYATDYLLPDPQDLIQEIMRFMQASNSDEPIQRKHRPGFRRGVPVKNIP